MVKLIVVPRKPSPAGVSFTGGEYFELPSRKNVEREVDVFVHSAESAEGTTCAFVLGEWGEGKTELYRGRIEPVLRRRATTLVLPASTLAGAYDLPRVRALLDSTPVVAEQFLVALFAAARADEDNFSLGIPEPDEFQSARKFIGSSLKRILTDVGQRRAYVFIDEFEELLNRPEFLIKIVSGLKELINGNFGPLAKAGEFSGALHFFLSCTPNAYLRLPKERSMDQVSGGFFRRTLTITLTSPPRAELVQFVQRLLQWCWEGHLPDPPPFKSAGIHEAIAYVTRGNLGACVKLVSGLLSKAEAAKVDFIDGPFMARALQESRLEIYQASAPCIEPQYFGELERAVRVPERPRRTPAEQVIISQLAGDHQPQSAEQLRAANPPLGTDRDVRSSIDEINRRLSSQFGLVQPILTLKPLKREVDFRLLRELILNAVTDATVIKNQFEGSTLQVEAYKEDLRELEERVTHFSIGFDGSVLSTYYFPSDAQSAMAFFEGISQKIATNLVRGLEKQFQPRAEASYALCDQVKVQLFPTPVPPGLEFVIDQRARLDIWREAGRDLSSLSESLFPGILPTLIDVSGDWKCTIQQGSGRRSVATGILSKEATEIRVAFSGLASDPDKTDISTVLEPTRRAESPAHLSILLFTGEITPQAIQALEKSGLGPEAGFRILPIQLNGSLVRRIVATGLCLRRRGSVAIDDSTLRNSLDELLSEQLGILPQLEKWLTYQAKTGLVINPLKDGGGSLQRMVQALRYFVNYPRDEMTAQAAWDRNSRELLGLQLYGLKTSFVPDIEASQLDRIAQDLLANGFLTETKRGLVPALHPVEQRVLELVRRQQGIQIDQLRQQFVDRTGTKAVEVVFLESLIDKGLIERTKGRTVTILDSKAEARTLIQRFNSTSEGVGSDPEVFERYGLLVSSKERGARWIDFAHWNTLLIPLATDLARLGPDLEWQDSSRIRLFGALLDTYESTIIRLIRESARAGGSEVQDLRRSLSESRRTIRAVVTDSLATQLGVNPGSIAEFSAAEEQIRRLDDLDRKPASEVDRTQVASEVGLDHFRFDWEEERTDFFNPKLALLRRQAETVRRELEEINSRTKGIGDRLSTLRRDESDTRLRARSVSPPPSAVCAKSVRSLIITGVTLTHKAGVLQTSDRAVTLDELLHRVNQYDEEQSALVHALGRCVEQLKELSKLEPEARKGLDEFESEWKTAQLQIAAGLPFRQSTEIQKALPEIRRELEEIDEQARKLVLDSSLERIRTFADECISFFENIQHNLARWRSDIEGVISTWEVSARDRVESLRDIVQVIPKGARRDEIESSLDGILSQLTSRSRAEDPNLFKDVNARLARATSNLYTALTDMLGAVGDLPKVIEAVAQATADGTIVGYDSLLQQIRPALGGDAKKAREQLDRLVQTGFLELLIRRRVS